MRIKDLSGMIFGMWKVLHIAEERSSNGRVQWLCRCECGLEKPVISNHLLRGNSTSCGCLKNRNLVKNVGVGDITKSAFNDIKRTATKRRNFIFDVTIEYLWALFINQNRLCAISGVELFFRKYIGHHSETRKPQYTERTASLDRIDNNLGYIEGNLQWVHKDINIMKGIFDNNYFLSTMREITEVSHVA